MTLVGYKISIFFDNEAHNNLVLDAIMLGDKLKSPSHFLVLPSPPQPTHSLRCSENFLNEFNC
jgi:hypothetical protein